VDKADNGTLELRTTTGVDSGGREGAPDDRLADVGGDEERDTATKTVALLEKLVKENDNDGGSKKLDDEENADTGAEISGRTVETSQDVNTSLAKRQDDGEELLGSLVELTVGLEVEVHIDKVSAGQKLEDHARGDNGSNTEFHEGTAVTGHHHSEPVERVGGVCSLVNMYARSSFFQLCWLT
jgi:hypothetical protein